MSIKVLLKYLKKEKYVNWLYYEQIVIILINYIEQVDGIIFFGYGIIFMCDFFMDISDSLCRFWFVLNCR